MRHLEPHQVVEFAFLEHAFDLLGQVHNLWVSLVEANMIKQVIEHVANHPNLLLRLHLVVLDAHARVSLDHLSSVLLELVQSVCYCFDTISQVVKALVKLLLLVGVQASMLRRRRVVVSLIVRILGWEGWFQGIWLVVIVYISSVRVLLGPVVLVHLRDLILLL